MKTNDESKTVTSHEDVKPNASGSGWLFVLGGKCFTSDTPIQSVKNSYKENYNHDAED